jgi:hypothetical protein
MRDEESDASFISPVTVEMAVLIHRRRAPRHEAPEVTERIEGQPPRAPSRRTCRTAPAATQAKLLRTIDTFLEAAEKKKVGAWPPAFYFDRSSLFTEL